MADEQQRMLCFEYLPKGSQDVHITARFMFPHIVSSKDIASM